MPASVSSSTVAPSARAAINPGRRACSTDSWNVTIRPATVTPRSEASRCSRRVSSTASTSAVAMASRSRGPTSPGCPRGAPPRTSRPVTAQSLSRPAAALPPHTLACMAVLEAERTAEDPRPPRRHPRRPFPRPVVDRTPPLPDDNRLAWLLAGALGLLALISRLWDISYPTGHLFDEAYYPPEAAELLRWGFEANRGYTFIVHPPLGKWLIASGEVVFGYDSVGWRFPSAVAGAIAVVVLVRMGRRLTGSTVLGLLAGLLLAVDGLSFTLGRLGLLDIFLQLFVVSAVACVLVDRDRMRERIRGGLPVPVTGFRLGPRGWRIAAGVLFGCACAVKWSGVYFLAFFAVLSLFLERSAWREAGVQHPTRTALRRGLPGASWALAAVPVLSYLASFGGWFLGET